MIEPCSLALIDGSMSIGANLHHPAGGGGGRAAVILLVKRAIEYRYKIPDLVRR